MSRRPRLQHLNHSRVASPPARLSVGYPLQRDPGLELPCHDTPPGSSERTSLTSEQHYLDAAIKAARYLVRDAWNLSSTTFPFEPGSDRAYFFDIGIIVRGLLAVWRITGEDEFRDRARDASLSLAFDFLNDD